MSDEGPRPLGAEPGPALGQIGRAERFAGGKGREIWQLSREDAHRCERLVKLGKAGIGGFTESGGERDHLWVVRRVDGAPLGDVLRGRKGPWPWREAAAVVLDLARGLAACEKSSLFPGPVTPDTVIVLPEGRAMLTADGLVRAMVGALDAAATRDASRVAPQWTPPPQADGTAWDSVANRYMLGLVLYRLLAGEHPFGGAGLRHALGEARHREAPPFVESVASALPSGLQSLTLRLMDPDPAKRPPSSAEIAEDLESFLDSGAPRARAKGAAPAVTVERAKKAPRPAVAEPAAKASGSPWLGRIAPIVAGIAIAGFALSLITPAPSKPASAVSIRPERPLSQGETSGADCARCHARQAAEWRRSVMAHAVKSPLFNALESLIEEQVGRDNDCPNGAGILRRIDPATACRNPDNGQPITGSGGEHWCVNCHSPAEKLDTRVPPWDGRALDSRSRAPVRDLLGDRAMEGISCAFCHAVRGPAGGRNARGYTGNPTWTSFLTGTTFDARPEEARGLSGIGNSGYDLRPEELLAGRSAPPPEIGAHLRPPAGAVSYLRTSEFCGSCHDVRLFGTDAIGVAGGEHFKRLRNAYSEWAAWAKGEARKGKSAASCQDCHMSSYPGTCEPDPENKGDPECPTGMRFIAKTPGSWPKGRVADSSPSSSDVVTHYFSGVDLPLARELPRELLDEPSVDLHGLPLSAKKRRDLLLRHTFRFGLGAAARSGNSLSIPVELENTGAGHRVPAGFSQEREFWVELTVRDGDGRTLYEVGHVGRGDEDLHDKVFARVNATGDDLDRKGRPLGMFGADVRDGIDVPLWDPPPIRGGTSFRGKGLINFQNGFLRCVRCIGTIGADGRCLALPGQDLNRADRFADGDYDLDTGECRSNLTGDNAFFETYFPVGALDATRGALKGPDAIIDTRSVPPGVPIRYTYDLSTGGRRGPFRVEARLLFRAFPPYLIRAFADYEQAQARRGLRPSGPLVTLEALDRLEIVEIGRAGAEIR
ncbi:MAG: hypothetical protein U0359_02770 [Byssovorax sp.]